MDEIKHRSQIDPFVLVQDPRGGLSTVIACEHLWTCAPPEGKTEALMCISGSDLPMGVFVPMDKHTLGRFIKSLERLHADMPNPAQPDTVKAC